MDSRNKKLYSAAFDFGRQTYFTPPTHTQTQIHPHSDPDSQTDTHTHTHTHTSTQTDKHPYKEPSLVKSILKVPWHATLCLNIAVSNTVFEDVLEIQPWCRITATTSQFHNVLSTNVPFFRVGP